MAKIVYAVKMKHLKGPGMGATGYHSVWQTLDEATRQCDLRNQLHASDFEYSVHKCVVRTLHFDYRGEAMVKLEDSQGLMNIEKLRGRTRCLESVNV